MVEAIELVEQHELQRAQRAHVHLALRTDCPQRALERFLAIEARRQLRRQPRGERGGSRLGGGAVASRREPRLDVDHRAEHGGGLGGAAGDLGVLMEPEETDGVVERQRVDVSAVLVEAACRWRDVAAARAQQRVGGLVGGSGLGVGGLGIGVGEVGEAVTVVEGRLAVERTQQREGAPSVPVVGHTAAIVNVPRHVRESVPRDTIRLALEQQRERLHRDLEVGLVEGVRNVEACTRSAR